MGRTETQKRVLVLLLAGCLALGGMMVAGFGKDPACTCPTLGDCQLYAALLYSPLPAAPGAGVPAGAAPGVAVAVPQPTSIGVVRLVYDSTPPSVSLPIGNYTIDLDAIGDQIPCPDCRREPPTPCAVQKMTYGGAEMTKPGKKPESVAIAGGRLTFAVTPETSAATSTVVAVSVTFQCTAKEGCGTAECGGKLRFGFKRAVNECGCGIFGFTLVVKDAATGTEQTVVRPAVFGSLDRSGDVTIEIGRGLNLKKDSRVVITISKVQISCLCASGFCPTKYPGDAKAAAAAGSRHAEVKFTDVGGCSWPTDTGWESVTGSSYWGRTKLSADPKTTPVYVDFEVSYGCAATAAGDCKAPTTGFCKNVFRVRFAG